MRAGVLWGCTIADYREVFGVDDKLLAGRVLEHACGPTAFNAEQTMRGQVVQSQDALFAEPPDVLSQHILSACAHSVGQVSNEGVHTFLADFAKGLQEGRYRAVSTPPFAGKDFSFDCALTALSLFEETDVQHYLAILLELARLAPEVRLYPLTDSTGSPAPLLGPLLLALQQANHGTEVREVRNVTGMTRGAMLRIWANECRV